MKIPQNSIKIFFSLSFTIFFLSANAQTSERKGYIGLGLGPSFLMGSSEGSTSFGTGLNLNLLNFGYVIGNGLGITATWVGGAHIIKNENVHSIFNGEIHYGMLMAGPMYSVFISDVSTVDFKVRAGKFFAREILSGISSSYLLFSSTSIQNGWGYSLAASYRFQFASRWCLILSGDYFSGPKSYFVTSDKVMPLSLTGGVGFLF